MSFRSLWTLGLLVPVAVLGVACDDKDDDDDDDDDDNNGKGGRGGYWGGSGGDSESSSGPRDSDGTEGSEDTEDPNQMWGSFDRYDSDAGCGSSWELSGSPTGCGDCSYAFDVVATLSFDECSMQSDFTGQLSFARGAAYLNGAYLGPYNGGEGYLAWSSSGADEGETFVTSYWGFVEW
jgi:hypothetical protein